MEINPLPEAEKKPIVQKPLKELSLIQNWTRVAVLGLVSLGISTGTTALFEKSHRPVHAVTKNETDRNNIPGTFDEERAQNPDLTENEYLNLLASRLTTSELLDYFFREKLEYMDDDSGERLFSLAIGEKNDYWQTPDETVRRVQKVMRIKSDDYGMRLKNRNVLAMRGDCEDYALLAQEVLWRQGKVSHAVTIPESSKERHAVCVWIERRPGGRFDGYALDNFGVNRNGTLINHSIQRTTNRDDDKGFDSLQKAFNAAVPGSENPKLEDPSSLFIPIIRLRRSVPYYDAVTIQAFDPDPPHIPSYVDFLAAMGVCATTYGAYRFAQRHKWRETWKEYFTRLRLV